MESTSANGRAKATEDILDTRRLAAGRLITIRAGW